MNENALAALLELLADLKASKVRIGELERELALSRGNVVVLDAEDAGRWSSDHAGTPNPGEGRATRPPATIAAGGVPGPTL